MSTKYHIETDKGTYEVEVDDAPPQESVSAPQQMPFDTKMQMAGEAAKQAWNLTPMAHPVDNLPMAGAMVGSAIAPGPGTAAGAGAGQIVKRMIEVGQGSPSGTPAQESVMPMVQATVAGLPEVGGVKTAIQNTAQNLAAKGVGLKGAILKRIGLDKAREVGQTMLDQGVIKPFSGTEATLDRAKDVSAAAGKEIRGGLKAMDDAGVPSMDPRAIAKKAYDQLRPGRLGGAYNNQENIAREIRSTILAHAKDGKTFASAQELKETLQDLGKFHNMSDQLKSRMYRQASGIVRQAIEDSMDAASGSQIVTDATIPSSTTDILPQGEKVIGQIETVSPDTLSRYQKAKKLYGASETAIEGLTTRANQEASSGPSLRGMVIAAGAASQGHVTPALEALGAWEVGSRYGSRTAASTLNFLNNSAVSENVRRAVMSEFISRITQKGKSNGE